MSHISHFFSKMQYQQAVELFLLNSLLSKTVPIGPHNTYELESRSISILKNNNNNNCRVR